MPMTTFTERLCGGTVGYGTIFLLDNDGGGWVLSPLYSFADGDDGAGPFGRLIFGPTVPFMAQPPLAEVVLALRPTIITAVARFTASGRPRRPDLSPFRMEFDHPVSFLGQRWIVSSRRARLRPGGKHLWHDSRWRPCRLGLIFSLTPSNGGWTQNILYQPRAMAMVSIPGAVSSSIKPATFTACSG